MLQKASRETNMILQGNRSVIERRQAQKKNQTKPNKPKREKKWKNSKTIVTGLLGSAGLLWQYEAAQRPT